MISPALIGVCVMGLIALLGAVTAWRIMTGRCKVDWPCMGEDERQTFAFLALFVGEIVLSMMWIALYYFEWMMTTRYKVSSSLSEAGQDIVWKLMAIHAVTIASIAIGNIISAKLGDWFEVRREESKNAAPAKPKASAQPEKDEE